MMSPHPPDMASIERVLIVKLGSIGDVVHALPVTAALAKGFPNVRLTWVVEDLAAPVVLGNPYLDGVIVLPRGWCKRPLSPASLARFVALRRELRARPFDLALDLQGLTKSAVLAWLSGARYRFGYDWLRELAPLLVTRIPRQPESLHIVDQLLDVARFLGAPVRPVQFPLDIPADEDAAALELLASAGVPPGRPFIVVNPTEGRASDKGWGAERWAELAANLIQDWHLPVVLLGGADDREIGETIQAREARTRNLIGRTSLKQLAAILRRATLHLSGDTGSAHLAAALGTPVVSLFGRSNPARLAPYGQADRVLHHRERCAAACLRFHERAPLNSSQKCLAPPVTCLAAIAVEEVVAVVRECLNSLDFAKESPSVEAESPSLNTAERTEE